MFSAMLVAIYGFFISLYYYYLIVKEKYGEYLKERTRFKNIEMFDKDGKIFIKINNLIVETNLTLTTSDFKAIKVRDKFYSTEEKLPLVNDCEMQI